MILNFATVCLLYSVKKLMMICVQTTEKCRMNIAQKKFKVLLLHGNFNVYHLWLLTSNKKVTNSYRAFHSKPVTVVLINMCLELHGQLFSGKTNSGIKN